MLLLLGLIALLSPVILFYIYGFRQGLQALRLSRGQRGAYAWTLRFLALNVCEPLITFVWLVVLWFGGQYLLTMGKLLSVIVKLPLSLQDYVGLQVFLLATPCLPLLFAPALGLGFKDPHYRKCSQQILRLSLARVGMVLLIWITMFTQIAPMNFVFIPFGFWLLWYCIKWGKDQLNGALAQPPLPSINPYATNSTPTPVPIVIPPPLIPPPPPPDLGPVIACPICLGDTQLHAADCPACGLVFVSRVPPALKATPGYHVLRPLGAGGMSSVYLARRASDELCVLKTLASIDGDADAAWCQEAARCLQRESELLRQLDHPNIARVLDWVASDDLDLLVLQYISGPTLEQHLSRSGPGGVALIGTPLPHAEVLAYGSKLAEVLRYLASLPQPVVHCDIKPANLILPLDSAAPILVDFGGAVLMQPSVPQTLRLGRYGTPGYAAPEQYHGDSSPKSDIYGLGTTLYHLLTDDDPSAHPLHFPALAALPTDIAATLAPALERDPAARPDAHTFGAELRVLAGVYQRSQP